uniref:Suppressor APC domain-containing protein n=1 Tax=Gadus morhua TaxID=8049 RepID=A0A8C5FGG1_GADMO
MALIPTDDCKLNNQSTTNGRICARKTGFQGRSGSFKSVRMQPKESDYSTDGLPKAFLLSLRTLFDILDDGRRGFVHISEIEGRWQGADTQDLPGGVLECLRRAAPPHGCLTFQRFVAGLRYSMLNPDNNNDHFKAEAALQTAKPYPNHSLPPQLTESASHSTCNVGTRIDNKPRPLGPSNVANTQQKPRATPLHDRVRPEDGRRYPSCGTARYDAGAGSMRHQRSREEQRRHTITNGVDYGMLKQMKELEQEKDSLLAGLEQVERARDWYQTQIHSVTERQQLVGQSDHCMEGSPSHINVLIPKLQEVNRCLNDLIACTEGEVTEKSDRITKLEQEKSALIKQLFEARAHRAHDTSTMDSTFI